MMMLENSAALLVAGLLLWHLVVGTFIGFNKGPAVDVKCHLLNSLALLPAVVFAPVQSFFEYYDSSRFITLCVSSGADADSQIMLALGQVLVNTRPLHFLGILALAQLLWISHLQTTRPEADVTAFSSKPRWLVSAGYFCVAGVTFIMQSLRDPQALKVWTSPAYELLHGVSCKVTTSVSVERDVWPGAVLMSLVFPVLLYWSAQRDRRTIAPAAMTGIVLFTLTLAAANRYIYLCNVHHQLDLSLAVAIVESLLVPFYASILSTFGALLAVPSYDPLRT